MNKHIQDAINNVTAAYPSIFTKDDVINLLKELSKKLEKPNNYDIEEFSDELIRKIRYMLEDNSSQYIDYDSIEFEIDSSKTINVTDGEINYSDMILDIEEIVEELIGEFKGEKEDEDGNE